MCQFFAVILLLIIRANPMKECDACHFVFTCVLGIMQSFDYEV